MSVGRSPTEYHIGECNYGCMGCPFGGPMDENLWVMQGVQWV